MLVEARKVKAGTAVLYRTRDVGGKTFLRQIVAAPKETAKVAAKGGGGTDTMTPTKGGQGRGGGQEEEIRPARLHGTRGRAAAHRVTISKPCPAARAGAGLCPSQSFWNEP